MSRPGDAAASGSLTGLREPPAAMQRLLRMVARGFYPASVAVALDIIIKERCVKENDLAALLQFDRKELVTTLATLHKDRLAKFREQADPNEVQVQTDPNDRKPPQQYNYWFVDWKECFEAIRYRMMKMRKQVEDSTKYAANPKSYMCNECGKTYGDLDVAKLVDYTTGVLRCEDPYCAAELVKDDSGAKAAVQNSRDKMAKLNSQLTPLDKLVLECKNVVLHESLRNPDISVKNLQSMKNAVTNRPRREDPNRRKAAQEQVVVLQPAKVEIEFADEEGGKNEARQRPKWLQTSTVEDDHARFGGAVKAEIFAKEEEPTAFGSQPSISAAEDAVRRRQAEDLLLAASASRASGVNTAAASAAATPPAPASAAANSEEEGDSDMESVEEEMVMVGGQRVAVSEVTDEQKGRMTDAELDEFTEKYQAYLERMGM
eukprot:m.91280 g.91280  ORF g.91280 m.91280 type:complete len:432 (-) comp15294_c0_seq3:302-1597(-)